MRSMVVRTDDAARRAFPAAGDRNMHAPAGAAEVFTQGFLNASLLRLAICAPPRHAATRRREQVYVTELGAMARLRIPKEEAGAAVR